MAMNAAQLGTNINDALEALSQGDAQDAETIWQTIAAIIITHLQNNMEVGGEVANVATGTDTKNLNNVTVQ